MLQRQSKQLLCNACKSANENACSKHSLCSIRSYRYTVAMFPLPYNNVLKYRTRQKCGRHFHLTFQYKMYQRVPPTFCRVRYSGSGYYVILASTYVPVLATLIAGMWWGGRRWALPPRGRVRYLPTHNAGANDQKPGPLALLTDQH
jgi:hypothetical protein